MKYKNKREFYSVLLTFYSTGIVAGEDALPVKEGKKEIESPSVYVVPHFTLDHQAAKMLIIQDAGQPHH